MPAFTKNTYGAGNAYFIAFRDEGDFRDDFYSELISKLNITQNLKNLPFNVSAHTREDENSIYLFAENYNDTPQKIFLEEKYEDVINGGFVSGEISLSAFGAMILKKPK